MGQICDACGEKATQWFYRADGPWAGKHICRRCARRPISMKRLSWAVTFRFRIAQVLPPTDPMTVPVFRLLMAVDDVRRAQILLVEAHERIDLAPAQERYLALGDFLYAMRHLFCHLHEPGVAVRCLDTNAKKRVDNLLAGDREALAALQAVRKFFNAADYDKSLIARVRNGIGSHYDDAEVDALVKAEVTPDALLESTAAEVGGLARMADSLVREIMYSLNGGDFLMKEEQTIQVAKAMDLAGHFITFVEHLFDALIRQHPDAIAEKREALLEIPPLVIKAREQVEEARNQLKAEDAAQESDQMGKTPWTKEAALAELRALADATPGAYARRALFGRPHAVADSRAGSVGGDVRTEVPLLPLVRGTPMAANRDLPHGGAR